MRRVVTYLSWRSTGGWMLGCLLMLSTLSPTSAQDEDFDYEGFQFEEPPTDGLGPHPFAGRYEPRVGASLLAASDRLRLDIGARISLRRDTIDPVVLDAGAEFFTWTRLRSVEGFKFPVESVDYDFGLYASTAMLIFDGQGIVDSRLRIAHISAHRVDGDPELLDDPGVADVYSREYIDLSVGASTNSSPLPVGRVYIGGHWLFNVIPDTLASINPYLGFDGTINLQVDDPRDKTGWLGLRLGAEFRLNREVEQTIETMLKVGLWIGGDESKGLMIEAGWMHGHSPFGPFYPEVASTTFVGFSLLR